MNLNEVFDQEPLDVKTPTPKDIALKHKVPIQDILDQLKIGIRIEFEHTSDFDASTEIALDHLNEFPDYYDRLVDMEKKAEQELNEYSLMHLVNKTKGKFLSDNSKNQIIKMRKKGLSVEEIAKNYGIGPRELIDYLEANKIEERVQPKESYFQDLDETITQARIVYNDVQRQEAEEDPDYDVTEFDADLWVNSLKYASQTLNKPFTWEIANEDQGDFPVSRYILSGNAYEDGTIGFTLWAPDLEDFDIELFKTILMRFLEHEAVHMTQRDRMGHDVYASRTTGFQKALKHQGDDQESRIKRMKIYLSDPQEIMAHARDLSNELKQTNNPLAAARDVYAYIEHLPTLQKYLNSGFDKSHRVMKRLLKTAVEYLVGELK